MSCRGVVKRFVPFLLTFAAGLFIASLFVPLTSPFRRAALKGCHEQGLIRENRELRETNERQRRELEVLRREAINNWSPDELELAVPPVLPDAPQPPPVRPIRPGHVHGR
ncbi:MAG: hypothetical protein ABI539_05225 [Acidobacteriota bacterium]